MGQASARLTKPVGCRSRPCDDGARRRAGGRDVGGGGEAGRRSCDVRIDNLSAFRRRGSAQTPAGAREGRRAGCPAAAAERAQRESRRQRAADAECAEWQRDGSSWHGDFHDGFADCPHGADVDRVVLFSVRRRQGRRVGRGPRAARTRARQTAARRVPASVLVGRPVGRRDSGCSGRPQR